MKRAFLFPGQGAQYVGMGTELQANFAVARAVFEEADEALGFSLSTLIAEGPEDQLRLTYYTQPALLVTSLAAYRVYEAEGGPPAIVCAGHSLGEYSALVAAGVLSLTDGVRLVHQRGRFMDEAVPAGQGAMAAVIGLDADALRAVCEQASSEGGVVELANVNCPGQIAISGTKEAVERAGVLAKEAGARRVIPLDVSGPFHCRLMQPAAGKLAQALRAVAWGEGTVPVVANVDAKPRTVAADIQQVLEQQLYRPVLWEADVRAMLEMGADTFIEFGPGTVLSGLVRKVDRSVQTLHVEDLASLRETLSVG